MEKRWGVTQKLFKVTALTEKMRCLGIWTVFAEPRLFRRLNENNSGVFRNLFIRRKLRGSNVVLGVALKPREFNFQLVSISRVSIFLENSSSFSRSRPPPTPESKSWHLVFVSSAILSKPLIEESFEKCSTQQWNSIQHFLWHFRLSTRSLFVNQHKHKPEGRSAQHFDAINYEVFI